MDFLRFFRLSAALSLLFALTGCANRTARNSAKPNAISAASTRVPFRGAVTNCDVLVVGGTPSGVAAAIAAARRGAHVILIEERDHLGGDVVYAMLNMFDVPMRRDGTSPMAYGIFGELFKKLGIAFDVNEARDLFEKKVAAESGIRVLRRRRVVGINKSGERVTGAVVEDVFNPANQLKIRARCIVDATNDADFAARAGAHFFIGRQKFNPDKKMQAAGLLFSVAGANWNSMKYYVEQYKVQPATRRVGTLNLPVDSLSPASDNFSGFDKRASTLTTKRRLGGGAKNYLWERGDVVKNYQPRGADVVVLSINFGRQNDGTVILNTLNAVNVNGLSLASKEKARDEMIAELKTFLPYLRHAMPGLKNATLHRIAPELYIRETRHLQGLVTIDVDDIRRQRVFPDAVARVSYPIDLHPYAKGDIDPYGPHRYFYTLPLRAFVPRTLDGVFVASRCLSATYSAAGSARVIPITMAAGEACGVAAQICAQHNLATRQMALAPRWWKTLQTDLKAGGVKIS